MLKKLGAAKTCKVLMIILLLGYRDPRNRKEYVWVRPEDYREGKPFAEYLGQYRPAYGCALNELKAAVSFSFKSSLIPSKCTLFSFFAFRKKLIVPDCFSISSKYGLAHCFTRLVNSNSLSLSVGTKSSYSKIRFFIL